ncbi:HlyU family transcriptional regulator [Allorhizobium borbori]|jgi:hypothetical protein|uniref:Transcriptional activator HlyU n=1 Tax=Allorhizobium borbori TaxID=485907 RepID=A0A7W6JZU6_9HYPH|nr:HlyU family transcriptional regulator [Allorhizobium borbori]MBB4102588.1 hypothetical protein [Allorhizobium borbori]PZU22780.1 MAG: transcriptional activator HlyU [Shinella sp.]
MASFFSKILSAFGGNAAPAAPKEVEPREYDGCRIFATPIREGSQFRLAGRIEKVFDGQVRVRNFIRADIFTNEADAVEFTFRKGEQILQQGRGGIFADGAENGSV